MLQVSLLLWITEFLSMSLHLATQGNWNELLPIPNASVFFTKIIKLLSHICVSYSTHVSFQLCRWIGRDISFNTRLVFEHWSTSNTSDSVCLKLNGLFTTKKVTLTGRLLGVAGLCSLLESTAEFHGNTRRTHCILNIPGILIRNHTLLDHLHSQTQFDTSWCQTQLRFAVVVTLLWSNRWQNWRMYLQHSLGLSWCAPASHVFSPFAATSKSLAELFTESQISKRWNKPQFLVCSYW